MWLEVSKSDFLGLVARLAPQRQLKAFLDRELHLSLDGQDVLVGVDDVVLRCPGRGLWPGCVFMPYRVAHSFLKVAPAGDPLRFTFENGRVKVGTTGTKARWAQSRPE